MITFFKNLFSKPQPYFPACPGVIPIIPKLIFASLDDSQLTRNCLVSRSWYLLVKTTPALCNRLVRRGCLNAAKAIRFGEDSIFPLNGLKWNSTNFKTVTVPFLIATIDPRHDFTHAIKAAKEELFLLSMERVFSKIVRCQCRSDLAAAKQTALQWQKKFPRLLLNVVEIESKSDLTGAENTAEHIEDLAAKSEAFLILQNPSMAKTVAEGVTRLTQKIDVLLKLAEKDPDMDLKPLKILAGEIPVQDQGDRYSAFYHIVKVEALRDLVAAKVTVATEDNFEIIENDVFCYKSKAYCAIVRVEARVNLNQAKITATLIVKSDIRDKALKAIAEVEADTDFAAAKATTLKIRNASIRCKALIEIIKKEAMVDLASAKATAQSIILVKKAYFSRKDPQTYMDKAFLKIIEVEARKKPSDARKTSKIIESSYYKALAFAEIAKHDPKHDFSYAKAEAQKLDHELDSSRALYKIVLVELLFNSTDAMATAAQITNLYYRFCALIKIGKTAQKLLK